MASPLTTRTDARFLQALEQLRSSVGECTVLDSIESRIVYEYDYGFDRSPPDLVTVPSRAEEIPAIVRVAASASLPVIPRGAGTGIAGGAVPIQGGIVISFSRMRSIDAIDLENRAITLEPGVVNLDISHAVQGAGFYFAPDPSSQKSSTIGGNAGNNAGGPHCLALGSTTNHILGLTLVDSAGESYELGGLAPDSPGYDLTGVCVGSEGTLGVITSITARILPLPESTRTFLAVFQSVEQASSAVSEIIARGIVPAALEIMDQLVLQAVEAAFHAGYPAEAGAVLLVEVDGLAEKVLEESPTIESICTAAGAVEIRIAESAEERALLWAGRKGAASAMGRVAPNYYLHDAVVARSKLPAVVSEVVAIARKYDLPIGNVFHAGDGNLHPMILFDVREEGVLDRVLKAGHEILETCIRAGGALSGEHGIGLEKNNFMPWIFTEDDLEIMGRVRRAFDPIGIFNPGKILPSPRGCADQGPAQRVASPPQGTELWI